MALLMVPMMAAAFGSPVMEAIPLRNDHQTVGRRIDGEAHRSRHRIGVGVIHGEGEAIAAHITQVWLVGEIRGAR